MAEYSYFEFACVCGIQYRVRYEGTYRCPCGRILELDWSFAAREAASASPMTVDQAGQKGPAAH